MLALVTRLIVSLAFGLSMGIRPASGQRPPCLSGCVPPYQVQVTVQSYSGSGTYSLNSGAQKVWFNVSNTGANGDTFTLSYNCSVVACTGQTYSSPIFIPSGGTVFDTVYFTVGSAGGTGSVYLEADGNNDETANATFHPYITPAPFLTLLKPDTALTGAPARALVHSRQPVVRAVFTPNGGLIDTGQTVLKWRDTVVSRALYRANRGLIEWEVDSAHQLGIGDSAHLTVTVCDVGALCTTVTRWVVLLNDQSPVLGFSGVPFEASGRAFAAPFGSGLAIDGADLATGVGTPAYFSFGTARAFGLTFSTRQSAPRILIPVDVELPWPDTLASKLHATLQDSTGTVLDSMVVTSPACKTSSARRCRVVLQADFSGGTYPSTPTREWLRVTVRVDSATFSKSSTDSVEAVLVDRRASIYGGGWWPTGAMELVPAGPDRVLIGSNGSATVYRGNGDSLYLSPPGDFTVLRRGGSTWSLSPRGSRAKIVFDNLGRVTNSVDVGGNADTVLYSGTSLQITALADPLGHRIALTYDANGNLSTVSDPGSRRTHFTVQTNHQLQYVTDSLSSSAHRVDSVAFTYQAFGSGGLLLTRRIGTLGDTALVTYDSAAHPGGGTKWRRPTQDTLVAVDTGGGSARPVVQFVANQRQGYVGIVSLDSVYAQLTDPRGNYTRALLNRWGQSRKTWDAVGTISQASYSPEGLTLWSEGKVTDSSRTYFVYDSLLRLSKSYRWRSAGHATRIDTLLYDNNFQIVKSVGAANDTTQFMYDTLGNITQTTDPAHNVGNTAYYANGQVRARQRPGNSLRDSLMYDSQWRNLARGVDESGAMVDTILYDGLGRSSTQLVKVRVRMQGSDTVFQWRRMDYFYNGLNKPDSVRTMRSDDCEDDSLSLPSCGTLRTWGFLFPYSLDTLHSSRVVYVYDRGNRDSLRLRDRAAASIGNHAMGTQYIYDRLGHLRSRRPWGTDSLGVRDSLVYDLVGNVRRSYTRRGDTLTTYFDSRNRPTERVIPGVGTLHWVYGGPNDQLTSMYYDGAVTPYVDSIGGINAGVGWAYDQRGRLLSDTSHSRTALEVTAYKYDTLDRMDTATDPIGGQWIGRFEKQRGLLDTLFTPMGDSIFYTQDAQLRLTGLTIRGGGMSPSTGVAFDQVNTIDSVAQSGTIHTNHMVFGKYDIRATHSDPQPASTPIWTEQHGVGAPVDSLRDSVIYDGWGRDTAWALRKNGSAIASAVYHFDRDGNIYTGYSQTYDSVTDRLVHAGYVGSTIDYTYDRAGNLTEELTTNSVNSHSWWIYQYNALNQLAAVYTGSDLVGTYLVVRYAYDVLGRRIAKKTSLGLLYPFIYSGFVYSGKAVAFDTDSTDTWQRRYTWGPDIDRLLAVEDKASAKHYYVVTDPVGSVRGLIRRDSVWVLSQRFDPYGTLVSVDSNGSGPGFALRYGWTGREYDAETGLYYFRSRYYHPGVARFIQEDPTGYSHASNPYSYAEGSPALARDPMGTSATPNPAPITLCGGVQCDFSPWPEYFIPTAAPAHVYQPSDVTSIDPDGSQLAALGNAGAEPNHEALAFYYTMAVNNDWSWTDYVDWAAPGRFQTPKKYEDPEFKLDFTDQHGDLHYFTLYHAHFELVRRIGESSKGARAIYSITGWDGVARDQTGATLYSVRLIPILSRLESTGFGDYTGGFVQDGKAGGLLILLP